MEVTERKIEIMDTNWDGNFSWLGRVKQNEGYFNGQIDVSSNIQHLVINL